MGSFLLITAYSSHYCRQFFIPRASIEMGKRQKYVIQKKVDAANSNNMIMEVVLKEEDYSDEEVNEEDEKLTRYVGLFTCRNGKLTLSQGTARTKVSPN